MKDTTSFGMPSAGKCSAFFSPRRRKQVHSLCWRIKELAWFISLEPPPSRESGYQFYEAVSRVFQKASLHLDHKQKGQVCFHSVWDICNPNWNFKREEGGEGARKHCKTLLNLSCAVWSDFAFGVGFLCLPSLLLPITCQALCGALRAGESVNKMVI